MMSIQNFKILRIFINKIDFSTKNLRKKHPKNCWQKVIFILLSNDALSLARWRGWSAVWASAGGALRDLADCLCQVLPQPHTLEDVQGDVHELETQNRLAPRGGGTLWKVLAPHNPQSDQSNLSKGQFVCPFWGCLVKQKCTMVSNDQSINF